MSSCCIYRLFHRVSLQAPAFLCSGRIQLSRRRGHTRTKLLAWTQDTSFESPSTPLLRPLRVDLCVLCVTALNSLPRYNQRSIVETIHPGTSAPFARVAVFDFDGTVSLIRAGWADII